MTQVLEQLALSDALGKDPVLAQELAQLCAIPLRDGCDLLDVLGRRLRATLIA